MADQELKNNPVIRISIASTIGDKKQISFETYVDAVTEEKVMHLLTDKLMRVADRQSGFAELKDLKRLLVAETNQYEALIADLERVNKENANKQTVHNSLGKRAAYELPPKEKQALLHIRTNIEVRQKRLETLKKDIEEREIATQSMVI